MYARTHINKPVVAYRPRHDAASMNVYLYIHIQVVICEDNLLGPHYVAQTMAHELIHAYDQCRAKINWKSDYHYACTEVRNE